MCLKYISPVEKYAQNYVKNTINSTAGSCDTLNVVSACMEQHIRPVRYA